MRTLVLIKSDLKNILRDRSMVFILIAPILILLIIRTVPPIYETYFPFMVEYRPLILGFFIMLIPMLAGFMFSFMMLDEKDQCLFPVFRVTPFSFNQLILYRIGIITLLGFLLSLIFLLASGLLEIRIYQVILLTLLSSLSGPIFMLVILSLARNKIEGVTYYKMLNMLFILPVAGIFIESPLRYAFGIIPFFWVYEAFETLTNPNKFLINMSIGYLLHLVVLAGSYRLFLLKNTH